MTRALILRGAVLVLAACSGKTVGDGHAAAQPGSGGGPGDASTSMVGSGGDAIVGSGGAYTGGDGGESRADAGLTLCVDTGAPSCSTVVSPGLLSPSPWTASSVVVPRGGTGFVFTAASGLNIRAVYVPAQGGCATEVSGELREAGISWGISQAAVGGSTRAVVMHCGGKYACGSELHRNGAFLSNLEPNVDIFGATRHRIAVAADGAIIVASSKAPNPSGDAIDIGWIPAAGPASVGVTRFDDTSSIVEVEAVDGPTFHGAALLFEMAADGGPGQGRIELVDRGGSQVAGWTGPPGAHITALASSGDSVAIGGTVTTSSGEQPWVAELSLPDLTERFQTYVAQTGSTFGLGFDGSTLVAGLRDATLGVTIEAISATDGVDLGSRATFPQLRGTSLGVTFGLAKDHTVLVASDLLIGRCAYTP